MGQRLDIWKRFPVLFVFVVVQDVLKDREDHGPGKDRLDTESHSGAHHRSGERE